MSKYSNTVEYKIKTSLDATGLTKLQQQLRQVQAEFERMTTAKTPFSGLEEAKKQLTEIQALVNSSFNAKLGMMDTKALTAGLSRVEGGLAGVYKNFSATGAAGKQAFATLLGQTSKLDAGLKQVSSTSDKIFNTLGNTVRWGLIASAFSSVMNAAHESVQYVKDLDESLTNIMMVTEYSRDAMNDYAKAANEAAKSLGSTTTAMTNATLVFAQQGFDLPKSQQLAETSTQLANISQQDTATASDEITAYMNAFNLDSIDEINNAMSKWAIVANVSAADVQELSIASQKAASTAVTVGVNMDQLAAQIAAIETVTREAPENIGNGLKTLYARLSDIGMGETVDGDVNLGKVTSTLEKVGVQVLTAEGNMRQVGDIMEDLMTVWGDLDLTQRTSIATTLAGKYQLSRFTALMNRSDLYNEYLSASEGETGTETFDEMQAIFEDSMQGRLNKLQAAIEGIFTNAFETDNFYDMIDAVTGLVEVFADLTEAIGGGSAAMTAFLAVGTKMFSGSIGKGVANFISNRQTNALRESNQQALAAQARKTLEDEGFQTGNQSIDTAAKDFANMNQYRPVMSAEQSNQANALVEQRVALLHEEIQLREDLATQIAIASTISEDATGQQIRTQEELLEYARKLKLEFAEMDPKALEQAAPVFNKAIASLDQMEQTLQKVQKGFSLLRSGNEAAGWDIIINEGTATIQTLEKIRRQMSLTGEEDQELAQTIKILSDAIVGETVDLNALQKGLDTAGIKTDQFSQLIERAYSKVNMQHAAIVKTRDELDANAVSQSTNSKQTEGLGEQVKTQEFATGVANAAGNIGQLIFAWQSFQSLGSLWANADMDLGQKVEETILNLAMGLPMLITGFTQLKAAVNGLDFEKFANQIQMSAAASGKSAAASGAAGIAYRAQGAAAAAAAGGVRGLGAAMNFLASGPGIALIAILTAASTAWNAYTQQIEETKDKEKETLTAAVGHAEEIKNSVSSWDNLYKVYNETGEVSQDLIKTGGELGSSLNVIGAKALAAAGDFDTLNQRIQKVKDQSYQETIDAAKNMLGGQYGASLEGQEFANASAVQDYTNQWNKGAYQGGLNGITHPEGVVDYVDAIRAAKQNIEELTEKEQQLENQIDNTTGAAQEAAKAELEKVKSAKQNFQTFLTQDDIQAAQDALKTEYEARIQMTDFQKSLDNAGKSAQDVIRVFSEDQGTKDYFRSLTSDAERYAEALRYVTDQTQRLNLINEYSKEKVGDLSEDQFTDFSNFNIRSSKYETGMKQFAEANDLTGNQVTQLIIQSAIDQVNQNSELTLEEKEAILSSVDWSGSIEDILTTLARGAVDSTTATLAQYSGMTDEQAEAGGDLSEDQLQEYNIDQGTIDAYNEQLQSLGSLAEQKEYYTDVLKEEKNALDKLKKSENASTKEIEDQEKAVADAQEALSDYEGETKDLTAKMIQTQKGLEKLGEGFEENGEILRNGQKNTLEYAEAMSETKDALGDVLNVDPGNLTNGFIEEHLDEIQSLAEGDISVLDDLRMAFGQDYLLNLNRTGNLSDADLKILQADLDQLNLTDVKVGAHVDDDAFVESLNQMMLDGKLTQDQVNTYLAGIGVEPEYETVPHDTTLFSTEGMHVSGDILGIPYDFELPHFEINGKVEVPQIKTSKSEGSGGHTGLRKTGGSTSGGLSNSYAPSGSGSGGSCFVAGTKVSMCGYYKNIEDVKIGDIVLSYNEELKRNEYSEVVQTMIHNKKEHLYTLYVENDKITTTGNHTFLIARAGKKQWVAAENLQINDLMLLANGSWSRLHTIVITTKLVKTYNFEVSNTHNYYVGEKQILAHNKGGKKSCFVAGTKIAMRGYYKNIEDIKPGDIVLSYNEKLHKNQYSTVLQTMIHDTTEKLYNLYIENEKLTVTGIHRFLISRNNNIKWIPASELRVGDKVLFANGTWHKISIIVVSTQTRRVYNFEVSNNHNYYVGHNQILAHNKGGGGKKNEPKEVNRTEAADAENDIYEKVNATLKKLEDQYSKTEKVANRLWGDKRRKEIEKQLSLLDKEKVTTKERLEIAKAYAKALKTGKSNLAYGINMEGKDSQNLKKYGLTDKDNDGVIDNYIAKFEQARLAAQAADKAADAYYKKQGGKINKKGEVTKEAKMTEAQEKEYKKLTDQAKKLWEKAEGINKATKEYEDTMAQIREDNEKLLELQQQMEDLAISMYEDALDATDALKDLKDIAAEIKGWQSGFNTDSPFRDLIEDSQRLSDIMRDDKFDIAGYYDDTIDKLKQMRDQYKKGSAEYKAYAAEIKFNEQEKQAFLNNSYGVGTGELAQGMMHFNQLQHWFDNAQKGISNLAAPYGTNEADLLKQYEEYYKDFTKLILETEERVEAMQKSAVKTMEESADRQEKVLKKYEKIQDDLERASKRVALWQGDDAYKAQAEISKQMAETAKSAAKAKKELYDTWKTELEAQKALEDANRQAKIDLADNQVKELEALLASQTQGSLPWLDTKAQLEAAKVAAQRARTDYSEAVDTIQEQVDDMWEQIQDDQDAAAEAMKDAYLATIDEINAAMTERLFGDRNLSNLTDDWDWDKDYFTTYKDTVEEAYEKEKLRLKYMDLLDDAQGMSLGIQRQIRDAMNEQLALLDGQATLSQYDVDLANARLEILQKQIALENAQQNKTQMKLRRDTQGNYKYVYSADQDEVRDRESELLDAQFDAYEMSKEANRNSYDSAISMYNQYVEQRKALAEKYQDDREKLDEELKKLDENYTRAAEANAEDLKNSYDGIVLSVEWMAKSNIENIANMTDEVLEGLKEHNQEALEAIGIPWNDAISNAIEDFNKIKDEAADTSAELIANAADFGDFISGDEGIGAVTGEQYGQAKEAIDSAKEATEGLKTETENLNKALTQELGATSAAEEKIAEYEAQLTKAKESSSALSQKLQSTQQSLVNAKEEQKKSQMAYQTASEESAAMKRMSSGKFQKGDEFYLDKGTVVYYGRGAGQTDSKGRNSYKLPRKTKVVVQNPKQEKLDGSGQLAEHHVGFYAVNGQGYPKMIPDQDNPSTREGEQWHLSPELIRANLSFDTGGYTGEWDDDGAGLKGGRLAWLHQKELILNAEDTENILMAVDVVRQITEGIKTLAAGAHLQGMTQLNKQSQGDTIEQRVEITAEFPNVNSAEEIKRALLGLADSAMQYSYREKNLIG